MQQYNFPNKPNFDLSLNPLLIFYAVGVIAILWLASGIYMVAVRADGRGQLLRTMLLR